MLGVMKRAVGIAMVPVLFGGCTLYSNTYGNAGVDGVLQVKFTVKEGFSQAMSNILINTCNWNYPCFSSDTDTVVKDLIGQQAINDCGVEVCDGAPGGPTDAIDAFYNRAFTNPGGFPSKDWTQRCVAFEVHTGFPDFWNENDAYYIIGTWQWYRPGSWNCGP